MVRRVAGLALPVDRDLLAVAGLDVPVDAVVGDVELAADEPLRERGVASPAPGPELLRPVQPVGLLGPERLAVGVGPVVPARPWRSPARRTPRCGGKLRLSVDRLSSVAPDISCGPPRRGCAGRLGGIARSRAYRAGSTVVREGADAHRRCRAGFATAGLRRLRAVTLPARPTRSPRSSALPGVAAAVDRARDALVALHNHPVNRRGWPATAAEASLRAARASAALDGAPLGRPDDAVAGPVLAGAVRVAEEQGRLLGVWRTSPLQALARLHVLAAADLVPPTARASWAGPGPTRRSRPGSRCSPISSPAGRRPRRRCSSRWSTASCSPWRPFGSANGVVARAAARLTAVATGLDPKGLAVPEVGHLRHAARVPGRRPRAFAGRNRRRGARRGCGTAARSGRRGRGRACRSPTPAT